LIRRATRLHGNAVDNAEAAVRHDDDSRSRRQEIAKEIAAIRSGHRGSEQ